MAGFRGGYPCDTPANVSKHSWTQEVVTNDWFSRANPFGRSVQLLVKRRSWKVYPPPCSVKRRSWKVYSLVKPRSWKMYPPPWSSDGLGRSIPLLGQATVLEDVSPSSVKRDGLGRSIPLLGQATALEDVSPSLVKRRSWKVYPPPWSSNGLGRCIPLLGQATVLEGLSPSLVKRRPWKMYPPPWSSDGLGRSIPLLGQATVLEGLRKRRSWKVYNTGLVLVAVRTSMTITMLITNKKTSHHQ